MSSDNCLIPGLFNAFFWPSVALDITGQATANVYEAVLKIKINDCCATDPQPFLLKNNTMFEVDSNNEPTGDPDVLLHSGCPDCLVVRKEDTVNLLLLISRRKNVTAAELKEFETQAECLAWYKPLILNTEHGYENCSTVDDDTADPTAMMDLIHQRLANTYAVPLNCMSEKFLYYPRVGFEWVQQKWSSLW
ncbi:uncharacterized protein LOC129604179 isoform X2 [Betta splendens]|nr:uncharacterized protein LOC129604179 isoform X2 [Betta splendens]